MLHISVKYVLLETKEYSCLEKVGIGKEHLLIERKGTAHGGGKRLPTGQIQLTGCFCMVHEPRIVFIF